MTDQPTRMRAKCRDNHCSHQTLSFDGYCSVHRFTVRIALDHAEVQLAEARAEIKRLRAGLDLLTVERIAAALTRYWRPMTWGDGPPWPSDMTEAAAALLAALEAET